eukprot:198921-Chlamydomonas_euryale.AAC.2
MVAAAAAAAVVHKGRVRAFHLLACLARLSTRTLSISTDSTMRTAPCGAVCGGGGGDACLPAGQPPLVYTHLVHQHAQYRVGRAVAVHVHRVARDRHAERHHAQAALQRDARPRRTPRRCRCRAPMLARWKAARRRRRRARVLAWKGGTH